LEANVRVFQWTKCPNCGRDWGVRLAGSIAAQQLRPRRSLWPLALPIRRPRFNEAEVWDCSCGARLRVARRRNRTRNFLLAGAIALVWAVICFKTGFVWNHPLLSWFLGIFVVILPLVVSGAGKHQVQVVPESASP
jgi:hypothetical protein